MLTFELHADGDELDVHLDAKGLQMLRAALAAVEQTGEHEHLMTKAWGGAELSEDKQAEDSLLLNKVTIHFWRPQPGDPPV